jgi:hypothetical protein
VEARGSGDLVEDRYDSLCCACWLDDGTVLPWKYCDEHNDTVNPLHGPLAHNRRVYYRSRWDDRKKDLRWRGKPDFCQNCDMHESEHANGRCMTQSGRFKPW